MGFAYADPEVLTQQQREAVAEHRRHVQHESRRLSLRALREEAELSQVEVAGVMKLSVDRIARMETGDLDRVQLSTLRRYAESLGARLQVKAIRNDSHAELG